MPAKNNLIPLRIKAFPERSNTLVPFFGPVFFRMGLDFIIRICPSLFTDLVYS